MKIRQQRFRLLFTPIFFGTLLLIAMLVSSVTKVFSQTDWIRYENNPILELGPSGSWDEISIEGCSVIFDGTIYHMWYTGNNGINFRIGHATSTDGISWTKDALNPVIEIGLPGSWEGNRVFADAVLLNGTTFHMWYSGNDTNGIERIGHATSSDGVNWTKDQLNPILDIGSPGSWEDTDVFAMAGSAIFNGTVYHMWYGGLAGSSETYSTGHATSPDGSVWTKDTNNPVMLASPPGNFDWFGVVPGTILFDGNKYQQWYSGSGPDNRYRIGYATSTDGVNWNKDSINNPVLDFGFPDSWDFIQAWSGSVLFDSIEQIYKMWYVGGPFYEGQIGYATSLPIGFDDNLLTDLPGVIVDLQNYPNPYKTSTTIKYILKYPETVILTIYDQFGKIVFQSQEKQSQGKQLLIWNANEYPRGIYYYKIQAGNQIVYGKMVKALR